MAPADQPAPASGRPLVVLFVVMLGLALWFTTRGWQASLRDRHEFRQHQTALSAYWLRETGYKLDYETPLFGPPWSVPMEFPVYQWVVATASRSLGTSLEGTGRAVSLLFFLATLPAVYGLAGLLPLSPTRRLLVVAAVLASPTYLFYARTFMIETTALCFATWFLLATARAVRDASYGWAGVALVTAVLAGLAKATTFVIFLVPGGVVALWQAWPHWRNRPAPGSRVGLRLLLAAVPVLVAVVVAEAWVKHSDFIKDSNPYSGFLTSRELMKWNWGTWEQRLSWRFWLENWRNISGFVLGEVPLAVLLLCATLVTPAFRRFAAWGAAFFLGGVMLFSNLFYHHDYYYCANALLLLTGAGVLLAGVWDNSRLPLAARTMALGLFFGGQLVIYHWGYADYARRTLPAAPEMAEVIQASVPAEDVVLVYGWEWNAMMPYYAARRMVLAPDGQENVTAPLEDILTRLPPRRITALLVHGDALRHAAGFVRGRTNRFHLAAAPFASSPEGDLYLTEEAMRAARARLQGRTFATVSINAAPVAEPNASRMKPVDLAALDLPMVSPKPVAARSMFGLATGDILGRKVLLAHPECELAFTAPPGATTIEADVGINEAAYAPGANGITDGISVEIFEQQPDGLRRVLYQRDLDPARVPADRGAQAIKLEGAGPFAGPVVFRLTPGPANNLVNDWAYWGHIRLH